MTREAEEEVKGRGLSVQGPSEMRKKRREKNQPKQMSFEKP